MNELHVSGVLVRAHPETMGRTQAGLERLPGVEVLTTTAEGHIVTVVERDSDAALADVFHEIQNSEGVLSASLVYHHSDTSIAQDEEVTS
jgi:nitrate reductase NapD